MRKNYFMQLVILFTCLQMTAQKASDILEDGVPIDKSHSIFLQYDASEKILKYDAVNAIREVRYISLDDSIFLIRRGAINVYLRPLNPLNYSYNTESKVVIDPINEAAATALNSIIDGLGSVDPTREVTQEKMNGNKKVTSKIDVTCNSFKSLQDSIIIIQTRLSNSRQTEIVKIFGDLKSISFINEINTIAGLVKAEAEIKAIESHFSSIETMIARSIADIKKLDCDAPDKFTTQYIFNAILKDFTTTIEEQKKRLTNLQTAYKLVKEMQTRASAGGGSVDLDWCIPLSTIVLKEGNITLYTITFRESGYKLSENQEIISIESREIMKKTLKFRGFQRFVPEVSIGTAFTFLEYNSYGTISDTAGQQFVASPTKITNRNLNITSFLNFNYYIPGANIHPFYQIGLGINSGIPTFLTGFGIRSNINGTKRLAIAGGVAMTWIKELDKLKVGDKISGTAEIENDYKYSSSPVLTPYFGIQINL